MFVFQVLYRWTLSCKSVEVSHLQHKKAQEEADAAAAEKVKHFPKRFVFVSKALERVSNITDVNQPHLGDFSVHSAQECVRGSLRAAGENIVITFLHLKVELLSMIKVETSPNL